MMKVFGILDPNVAKLAPQDELIPLKLNGSEQIGVAAVKPDGTVQGEIEDRYRSMTDGRGYGFEAESTEGKPVASINLVVRA